MVAVYKIIYKLLWKPNFGTTNYGLLVMIQLLSFANGRKSNIICISYDSAVVHKTGQSNLPEYCYTWIWHILAFTPVQPPRWMDCWKLSWTQFPKSVSHRCGHLYRWSIIGVCPIDTWPLTDSTKMTSPSTMNLHSFKYRMADHSGASL